MKVMVSLKAITKSSHIGAQNIIRLADKFFDPVLTMAQGRVSEQCVVMGSGKLIQHIWSSGVIKLCPMKKTGS